MESSERTYLYDAYSYSYTDIGPRGHWVACTQKGVRYSDMSLESYYFFRDADGEIGPNHVLAGRMYLCAGCPRAAGDARETGDRAKLKWHPLTPSEVVRIDPLTRHSMQVTGAWVVAT